MSRMLYLPPAAGLSLVLTAILAADTTIDDSDKFAWATNTGWGNFAANSTDGVVVGGSFLSGHGWAANTGWMVFGDGSPANGHTYANASAADFGVNHDGAGNLTGYAWSPNTGWLNFGWTTSTHPDRPRIDLQTGAFAGHAWSANTGWLNLGTGLLVTTSIFTADSDTDGIADDWEMRHFASLGVAGIGTDHDGDGVTDRDEHAADSDPDDAADFLRVLSQSFDAGLTEVTLDFATTRPSRLYRIEYSNDLGLGGPWTDSSLGIFGPDAGTTTTKAISFPAHPRKFFRVVVLVPLSP